MKREQKPIKRIVLHSFISHSSAFFTHTIERKITVKLLYKDNDWRLFIMRNVKKTQLVKTMLFSNEEFDKIVENIFPGENVEAHYDTEGLYLTRGNWGIDDPELNEKLSGYFGVKVTSVHLDSYPNVWVAYKEPERYNEKYVDEDGVKSLMNALDRDCREDAAEYLAGLLMDDSVSTYGVFEDLSSDFIRGNRDFKLGMDMCFAELTGLHMNEFAKGVLERSLENEEELENG